jgi:hypothetical protein
VVTGSSIWLHKPERIRDANRPTRGRLRDENGGTGTQRFALSKIGTIFARGWDRAGTKNRDGSNHEAPLCDGRATVLAILASALASPIDESPSTEDSATEATRLILGWLDRSGQLRRKNLIAGSICLAVLPCFALFAVAQQQSPATQQPGASQQPAAAKQVQPTHDIKIPPGFTIRYDESAQTVIRSDAVQRVQPTHVITMPPGFSIRYKSPRPFASIVSGNINVADAVPGSTDQALIITSQPEAEGQTNFLLVDGSGQEVGNVVVTVQPVREANKVVIHNKIKNLPGYTN